MRGSNEGTNVYYLAPLAAVAPPPPPPALALRVCVLTSWWRLRRTVAEVVAAVRRFGRPALEDDAAFLDRRADLVVPPVRPPAGPARVIDLAAARQRLRA
jgi:hypothetical protein